MVQSISTAQHSTDADYVINSVFCQPLKWAFSLFNEEVFYFILESEVK